MAGLPFKKICMNLVDLLAKRIILLVIIAVIIFYSLVDRHVLKLKTANFLFPEAAELNVLRSSPGIMEKERLKDILNYYKMLCSFTANDPEQPAPCSLAGYAYYYLGDTDNAIKYYEQAVRGNPNFFWFHYNLGVIYYNENNYDKAAEKFTLALNSPNDNAMLFMLLTKTYQDLALFLKIDPDSFMSGLEEGFKKSRDLLTVCLMLKADPGMERQLQLKKVPLRLF